MLTDYGPILFGGAIRPIAVDWFEKGELDIIVGGCKGEVVLYERIGGTAQKPVFAEPAVIGKIPSYISLPLVFDWNRDGIKDMLVAGRDTIMYLLKNVGTNRKPELEFAGPFRDENGLVFSVQHYEMDDEGGYIDERFFNHLSPAVCDWYGDGGDDLLVGDSSGCIWILEDVSQGKDKPLYIGEKYRKPERRRKGNEISPFIKEHGEYFSRPLKKLNYADGKEIKNEGIGIAVCDWDGDGDIDLLVLCTEIFEKKENRKIEFIENTGTDKNGNPQLVNRGTILADSHPVERLAVNSGFCVCDWDRNGYLDLLACKEGWSELFYYKNIRNTIGIPELACRGCFCESNTGMHAGYVSTSVDWNGNGLPDLLEGSWEGYVDIRENIGSLQKPLFKLKSAHLCNEKGPIRVYGETDPDQRENGGVSRPVLVDWNNDGILDLLVGSDTGHIYYYQGISRKGEKIPDKFHSTGPLKDNTGKVIKVHNRAAPVVIDTNGNGRLDLLVAGATYQMGFETEPDIGGDIQVFENTGSDRNGNPILAPGRIFEVDGKPFKFDTNVHCIMHKGDIDGDGKEEIVFFTKKHGARVIRNTGTTDKPRWHFAEELPGGSAFGGLADITGNGLPDAVFGGGEYGMGMYRLNLSSYHKRSRT